MRIAVWARWGIVPALATLLAFPVAAPARAASFGSPVVVSEQDAGEPGIDVARDGTIYVNAPSGLLSNLPGSPSFVWRSDDGGASWRLLPASGRANLPGGGDVDLSIDPRSGALALTDLWLGSATVGKSTDRGESWQAQPLEGVVVQDRQWVASAGGGVVYHATHQIPSGLIVSKSIDGGLLYPLHSIAATVVDQTGCVCPPGTLIAERGSRQLGLDDRVGLVYATSSGGVKLARSTNGGLTFRNVEVKAASDADTAQAFPVVANGGGGELAAVWQEVRGGRSTVWLATSDDWGATWSQPKQLVSGGTSLFPWADRRGDKIAVSLYHTDAVGEPGTVPEGSAWFESYLESTDGGASFSGLETVDPTPVKTGPICTEGVGCTGDRELLDFQSVAIDPSGASDLTWTRSVDGRSDTQIRFAHQTG